MDDSTKTALLMTVEGVARSIGKIESRIMANDFVLAALIQSLPDRTALRAALRDTLDSETLQSATQTVQLEARQQVARYLALLESGETAESPHE